MKKETSETQGSFSVVGNTVKLVAIPALLAFLVQYLLTYFLSFTFGVSEPWQKIWDGVVDKLGEDPFTYHVYATAVITNGVYFGVGAIFMIFDLTSRPKFLRKYKIQEGTNEPLEWDKFVGLVKQIVWNQILVGIFFNFFTFWLHTWRGSINNIKVLPSMPEFLGQLVIFVIIEETMFFYSHWALHSSRFLCTKIHKKHHEWQATVAYAAIYAHPIEHFVSNLLPAGLGPIVCGSHPLTMWIWYTIVISVTLNSHSGYHLPFLPSPEAHDFHHLRFNQCFGTLGIFDYFHGTDAAFRQSKAFKRHITLMTFQSAKEIYPD